MSGAWLWLPFFIVRFGLPALCGKKSLQRAAHFAPVQGKERIAYVIYQLATAVLFVYSFFAEVIIESSWGFYSGVVCYVSGLLLCAVSLLHFSTPAANGLNTNGLYRFSRNPMYVSYFICFMGMAALSRSWVLLVAVILFQIAAHGIILSEERWCTQQFGDSYKQYMQKVRRYI